MSDFSLFSLFTAGLACMVPFASAYTTPVGEPQGNAIILPGLHTIVPAGQGYNITWQPTTEGPVTLVLLKGPAADLKLETVIVEGTENDGSYIWTPSTSLEPTAGDTGYGIQLIVDSGPNKGQYQYTTQFGISNPEYKKDSSSSTAITPVAQAPSYDHTSSASVSAPAHSDSTSKPLKTASATVPAVYPAPYPTAHASNTTVAPTGYVSPPAGYTSRNATGVAPTGGLPNGTGSLSPSQSIPASTGAASTMTTSIFGLVLAAGVAVLAY